MGRKITAGEERTWDFFRDSIAQERIPKWRFAGILRAFSVRLSL
jgi:hypothetical protein